MADDSPTRDENMIAALKRERATYVQRGDDDRVAQVDEQLKHYGYEGEQDPAIDPATGAPKGRTTPEEAQQRTADDTAAAQASPTASESQVGGKEPAAAKKAAAKRVTGSKPSSGA